MAADADGVLLGRPLGRQGGESDERTHSRSSWLKQLLNSTFLFREGESSSAWSRTMETEDNATAHHVPGLQPFTTYMFRVAARNALGFSKPSRESYPTMTHREREYH